MITNVYRVSFGGFGNVLKLDGGNGHTTVSILKKTKHRIISFIWVNFIILEI